MKSGKDLENKKDKIGIAIALLVIIIVGTLAVFLTATYYPDIIENLFKEEESIEIGDLADVHYVGRYASNNTIFDTSYEDPENKTGGSPLQVFVTLNSSKTPPSEYNTYSNMVGDYFVKGFIEGLVGLKINQNATIDPLPPEEAYGVSPKIGDTINFSAVTGTQYVLKIIDIQKNASMPAELVQFFGNESTTIYVLREESHYIGEIIDTYTDAFGTPIWENATVVTKINETMLWKYTTPPKDKYENLSWVDTNLVKGFQIIYPQNTSKITMINDTTIIVTHYLKLNDTIKFFNNTNPAGVEYIIENITDEKIVTYLNGTTGENKTIRQFDRTTTIQRNETQNITQAYPEPWLEYTLTYLRQTDNSIKLSLNPLADKTVYFEVKIVKIYKVS
ncbi:MAG: FKBP-type peptidyl-prolyl cis-trans isomerase [Petrotogales bacterium]